MKKRKKKKKGKKKKESIHIAMIRDTQFDLDTRRIMEIRYPEGRVRYLQRDNARADTSMRIIPIDDEPFA